MKRIFKTVCLLVLCTAMLVSSVIPVSAYEAKGTQLLEQGEVSEEEAIILNLFDYMDRNVKDQIEGSILDFIKDGLGLVDLDDIIEQMPGGKTVIFIRDVFMGSAYAFADLGTALNEWRGQKKESLENINDYFTNAHEFFWEYAEIAYTIGKKYSGTNQPLHDMTDYQGENLDAKAFGILTEYAQKIEKAKSERVFKYSSKCKKQIQEWADVLYDMHNRMPGMQAFYNLGRFGSFHVPDEAAFIKTDVPCMITSKSTGKLLNVYTHSSAKNLKNGVKVNVYKYVESEADTQTFTFVDNGDGTYRIRVSGGTKYIDIYNKKTDRIAANGAKVQVWEKDDAHWRDQSFIFECEDGYYRILLAANPDYCLYIKSNGYLALGKTKTGTDSQLWKILYQ